jgi:hypothetical protein
VSPSPEPEREYGLAVLAEDENKQGMTMTSWRISCSRACSPRSSDAWCRSILRRLGASASGSVAGGGGKDRGKKAAAAARRHRETWAGRVTGGPTGK